MRTALRLLVVAAVVSVPMASLAVAKNESGRSMSGAGFVLYVALKRP